MICLRVLRARWMRRVAIYESFAAFEACVKESRSLRIVDVGHFMLACLGGVGSKLVLAISAAGKQATLVETYDELQRRRREGVIAEGEFVTSIDDLYSAVLRQR